MLLYLGFATAEFEVLWLNRRVCTVQYGQYTDVQDNKAQTVTKTKAQHNSQPL